MMIHICLEYGAMIKHFILQLCANEEGITIPQLGFLTTTPPPSSLKRDILTSDERKSKIAAKLCERICNNTKNLHNLFICKLR